MPLLPSSSYRCPLPLCNPHMQTILPVVFRPHPAVSYRRVRIDTADGDFFDIDTATARADGERGEKVAIVSHGLEGNTTRRYMKGMARALIDAGWDVAARNFRGCSGEDNRLLPMYHSGQTVDVAATVAWCVGRGYGRIVLVGFSMGGNQTLKYLGEDPAAVPEQVVGAAAFSVPCDLVGAAEVLDRPANAFYMAYFMRMLRPKMREKARRFPGRLDITGLDAMRTFREFDERFTAPLNGFDSARDYWTRASCGPYLHAIRVPTLLVNAQDDPFLSPSCFPMRVAEGSPVLTLETPRHGGHVGFVAVNRENRFWSESRAVAFFDALGHGGQIPGVLPG